jgi:plastocyanin
MSRLFAGLQVALLAVALPGSANAAVPPLLPSVATVLVMDFKFNPPTLTVHVGDRVTFVNDDDEAHTVTADDKSFDSEGLDTTGTWQHVFTKPGTYHYFCELHPYMKGTIVALPAAPPK